MKTRGGGRKMSPQFAIWAKSPLSKWPNITMAEAAAAQSMTRSAERASPTATEPPPRSTRVASPAQKSQRFFSNGRFWRPPSTSTDSPLLRQLPSVIVGRGRRWIGKSDADGSNVKRNGTVNNIPSPPIPSSPSLPPKIALSLSLFLSLSFLPPAIWR